LRRSCLTSDTAECVTGIDIEPDGAYFDLVNITIRNSFAKNNYGHGLQAWINSGDARNISIIVENYHISGGPGPPGCPAWLRDHTTCPPSDDCKLWPVLLADGQSPQSGGFVFGRVHPPGGSLVIRDSSVRDTPLYGIYAWDIYGADGFRVKFSNVTLTDVASHPELLSPYSNQAGFSALPNAPVGLDYLGEVETGIVLENVSVFDALRRPWMQVNSHWAPASIVGSVTVVKKVIQPMPSCWVNSSAGAIDFALVNLTIECDVISVGLKSDDDSTPPQRYSFWWAIGEPSWIENFTHGQFGIRPRNDTVNSQFSNSWPRIHSDGTIVNGGVPQRGNLSLHLEEWSACVNNEKHGGPGACTNM
jgi:hypothetical protein